MNARRPEPHALERTPKGIARYRPTTALAGEHNVTLLKRLHPPEDFNCSIGQRHAMFATGFHAFAGEGPELASREVVYEAVWQHWA